MRLIRLVGHPGAPRKRTPAARLTLEVRGRTIPFQTERVDVLRGDVLGADVLAEISAHRPSLRLRGAAPVLARLEGSTANDQVEIVGYHRAGSQELLVSDITVSRAAAGKPG